MLSLLVALPLLAFQGQPPRLRTVLPNRAVILVEPMPSTSISVHLWASARGVEERPETHGLRHVMEHILALGPERDLDRRLEVEGGSLVARTFRDATQMEISVPAGRLDLAIDVLRDLLRPIRVDPKQLVKECDIMSQEFALLEDDARLSNAAWSRAYGVRALDPFGNIQVIREATSEALETIRRRQFIPSNLAVVIAGPVDLDGATQRAQQVLAGLSPSQPPQARQRTKGLAGSSSAPAYGEARGALVPGFGSNQTASALAAALAIGSKLDDCFVTYTPSAGNGLVVLGRTEQKEGLGSYVDALTDSSISSLYSRGKVLAKAWVERQLRTPSGVGYMRGLLLCQGMANRPESMLQSIETMRPSDFAQGVLAFKRQRAASVEGDP